MVAGTLFSDETSLSLDFSVSASFSQTLFASQGYQALDSFFSNRIVDSPGLWHILPGTLLLPHLLFTIGRCPFARQLRAEVGWPCFGPANIKNHRCHRGNRFEFCSGIYFRICSTGSGLLFLRMPGFVQWTYLSDPLWAGWLPQQRKSPHSQPLYYSDSQRGGIGNWCCLIGSESVFWTAVNIILLYCIIYSQWRSGPINFGAECTVTMAGRFGRLGLWSFGEYCSW